jgi:hypothetical protein
MMIIRYVIFIGALCSFTNCQNRQQASQSEPATAVSPTLDKSTNSDDFFSSEYRRYKGDENLVEKLYQDLIQKRPDLKQFELQMDSFSLRARKTMSVFTDFDEKSAHYYYAAENQGRSLHDTLLRKEVRLWLEKSRDAYKNQTTEWTNWLKQFNEKDTRLSDYHKLMKIHLTLPLIEDFQKKRLPPMQAVQKLLLQQAVLQKQIDSLMQK